jgi:hypothetical protein
MSPFSHKADQGPDKQERLAQWRLAMRAEIERLSALPLTGLAAEVMVKGFGPGAPGAADPGTLAEAVEGVAPTAGLISFEFAPDRGFSFPVPTPEDMTLRGQVTQLVAEGLQQLEHASLVRCQMHRQAEFGWAITRAGRAALGSGEVPQILKAASR